MWRSGWLAICVVLIALALVVALFVLVTVRRARVGPARVSGGGGPSSDPVGEMLNVALPSDEYYNPFTEASPTGGASASDAAIAKKKWTDYDSWDELDRDKAARKQYWMDRKKFITDPEVEWSEFYKELKPMLSDSHEYIGIADVDEDGFVRIKTFERSPKVGRSKYAIASISKTLAEKYLQRPAQFIFHTHPDKDGADPLPSSQDISVSILYSFLNRHFADVVVSKYGVHAMTVAPDYLQVFARKAGKNKNLGNELVLNYRLKVVAAHEAVSSWRIHRLRDRYDFYTRHGLVTLNYPTPKYVADAHAFSLQGDIGSAPDVPLILSLIGK